MKNIWQLRREFVAQYEVDTVNLTCHQGDIYDFFPPRRFHSHTGLSFEAPKSELILHVRPHETPAWFGRFVRGVGTFNGLFSTPSPDIVCIILGGQGYLVDVNYPHVCEIICVNPINIVVPSVCHDVLVCFDYVRAAGYGAGGLLWQTTDLSWDGIELDEIGLDYLSGRGWDSPEEQSAPFCLDLRTGAVEGGSGPSKYGL